MNKKISILFSLLFLVSNGFAQTKVTFTNQTIVKNRYDNTIQSKSEIKTNGIAFNGNKCGSGIIHNHRMNTSSQYKQAFEEFWKVDYINYINTKSVQRTATVYRLPVVFHVIHKGEAIGTGTNISSAQIKSAIDALNRDFRKTSADGGISQGNGIDCEIEFCLATYDPNGNVHSGINRVNGNSVNGYSSSGIMSSNESVVKNLSKWDSDFYINVWVVSEIENNNADQPSFAGGTLGYAYIPTSLFNQNDGIVILHNACGSDPTNSKGYNLLTGVKRGHALSHEMGHVLGLLHTFEGNTSCVETNCNSQGDNICDTPPALQTTGFQSCSSAGTSGCQNQQIENYMDYTPDVCQNMFTLGQKDAMRAALTNLRSFLLQSTGCQSPSPVADFTANITSIKVGQTVNFTDLSTNQPTSWSWTFGDGGTSTIKNPSRTYTASGLYTVSLTASNATGSDKKTKTNYIQVDAVGSSGDCDTIRYPLSGKLTLYRNGTDGFISGTNKYKDLAKADYFDGIKAGSTISKVMIAFGAASASTSNSVATISLWDNTGTGGTPGAIIGSKTVLISTIKSNISSQLYTLVDFGNSVTLTGNFYAGIRLNSTPGDTVAIITNNNGDANPNTAWEQWSDNSWHTYSETNTWNLAVNHSIHPIVCPPKTLTNFQESGKTRNVIHIYPNPTNSEFVVSLLLEKYETTKINILTPEGKLVKTKTLSGIDTYKEIFSINDFDSGIYFIQVLSENGISVEKIIILK